MLGSGGDGRWKKSLEPSEVSRGKAGQVKVAAKFGPSSSFHGQAESSPGPRLAIRTGITRPASRDPSVTFTPATSLPRRPPLTALATTMPTSSTAAAAASSSLSPVSCRRSSEVTSIPATPHRSPPCRLLSSSSPSKSPLVPVSAMASPAAPGGEAASRKKLLIFDAEEDLAASLAAYVAALSEKFAAERDAFTVVLSGGSLVNALRKLAEPPYQTAVDWSKWHVFWADERVVPKDHADSNYKLAMDGFLSKVPIPANQVYAINDTLSAERAAGDYETCLKQLVKTGVIALSPVTGFPKFDLMLLGMGTDGHVGSLFPGHPIVNENQKLVTYIKDSPKPPPERITLTFPVINSSAHIALVVTGAGKAGALHKALSDKQSSSDLLPVEMVELQDGEFTWFTDKPAVSMLLSI